MSRKTILVDAWNSFVIESGINIDMLALLNRFDNPKIIATNANASEMVKFGIVDMPYHVFTLEHNPNKPDPSYYRQLLEHFNLDSSEVVYFEHNPEAVESARSVGIDTHYYDKDVRDLAALEAFLVDKLTGK
jgi:HAD superfamily hydrolase (TIGR01509 family)